MNTKKYALIVAVILSVMVSCGFALDLQETLELMGEQNAELYIQSAVTAFGQSVNSGTFRTAKVHSLLGFDLGFSMGFTSIPDQAKYYQFYIPDASFIYTYDGQEIEVNLPADQVYAGSREVSSFLGPSKSHVFTPDVDLALNLAAEQIASQDPNITPQDIIEQDGGAILSEISPLLVPITAPSGFNIDLVPVPMPQVSLGLFNDIDVMLRYIPPISGGDYGDVSLLGMGARIGLNQFIPLENPLFPRITAGYTLTNLDLGDVAVASNSITTLQVSKGLPFITLYGGLGWEKSTMDVDYDYLDPTTQVKVPIEFSLDGKNETRIIAGLRLKLMLLAINLDYNEGEYTTYSGGISISLR